MVYKDPENEEAIHDLRISIKRIKAFLKFVEKIDNQFEFKKMYQPWRDLFKDVGQYRDNQVLLNKLFEKSENAIEIKLQCDPLDIKPLKINFSHDFLKNVKKVIKHSLMSAGTTSTFKAYLENRIGTISYLLNLSDPERELKLHVLRKLLKELNYNLKFLRELQEMKFKGQKLDAWLDKMMDLLGNWHDNKLAISALGDPNYSLPLNLKGLAKQKIKKELISESDLLKSKISKLCSDKKTLGRLLLLSQNF